MKTWRGAAWALALLTLGLSGSTARASWCNAFEVCWHRNQSSSSSYYYPPPSSVAYYVAPTTSYYVAPTTSYYVAPTTSYYVAPTTSYYAPQANSCAPSCTPCQTCQTNYVQRSYYQPVTEMQSQSYYEKVTTTNTSYYYEPVTSYSYSSYYDACSCSSQQVAKPTTSYYLRAQSCPVDSWVQRCQKVPVTTYKQSFYYEPVTTCSSSPVVAAAPAPACNTCTAAPAPTAPLTPQAQQSYYPQTDARWQSPPAGVSESTRQQGQPPNYERSYPPNDKMPPASGSSYQPNRNGQAPVVAPTPAVHLERFASTENGQVKGQVVAANWQPAQGTRLVFINAERREARQDATTDNAGNFQAQLTSGGWLVYIEDAQGKPVFSRQITIRSNGPNELIRLVSR
ncbi:hypothetical protein BH10PLA2_BH10PLA2_03340 [soil metagenome]